MKDSDESDANLLRRALEKGIDILCDAVGIDSNKYDTDHDEAQCFLDCFEEIAEALKTFNVGFDEDEGQFVIKNRGRPNYTVWMEEMGFNGVECFDSLLSSLLAVAEMLSKDRSVENPVYTWKSEPTEDKAIWEITLIRHPAF